MIEETHDFDIKQVNINGRITIVKTCKRCGVIQKEDIGSAPYNGCTWTFG